MYTFNRIDVYNTTLFPITSIDFPKETFMTPTEKQTSAADSADDDEYEETDSEKIRYLVYAALFAALIAAGAYIRIMVSFVPITLQTFFAILAAVLLGRKWGTISVAVYLLVGIIGLPVFSGGLAGTGVFLGPTGGYLYGLLPAAFITGFFSDKLIRNKIDHGKFRLSASIFCVSLVGVLLILLIGTYHLKYVSCLPENIVIYTGFLPFVPGEIAKVLVIVPAAGHILKKAERFRIG